MDQRVDAGQTISLPAELKDWAESHGTMLNRLNDAITANPALPEAALWDIIAADASPDWTRAKKEFKDAEQQFQHVMLPENMPLGLIGKALHSEETNAAERAHIRALASFTVIDEELRQQKELKAVLHAARMHQKTICQSLELSRKVADMTAAFANVSGFDIAEIPAQRYGMLSSKSPLRRAFSGTRKIMHRTSAALKGQPRLRVKPAQGM